MRNQTSYYSITNQISHLNTLKKEVPQYYQINYTSVWDLALIERWVILQVTSHRTAKRRLVHDQDPVSPQNSEFLLDLICM